MLNVAVEPAAVHQRRCDQCDTQEAQRRGADARMQDRLPLLLTGTTDFMTGALILTTSSIYAGTIEKMNGFRPVVRSLDRHSHVTAMPKEFRMVRNVFRIRYSPHGAKLRL